MQVIFQAHTIFFFLSPMLQSGQAVLKEGWQLAVYGKRDEL